MYIYMLWYSSGTFSKNIYVDKEPEAYHSIYVYKCKISQNSQVFVLYINKFNRISLWLNIIKLENITTETVLKWHKILDKTNSTICEGD